MKYLLILFSILILTLTNIQKPERKVSEAEIVQPRMEQTSFRRIGEMTDLQMSTSYRHRVLVGFGEDDRGF